MKNVTPRNWTYYAPENTVIYAIGDLHGYLDAHETLYAQIEEDAKKTPKKKHLAVYLGDYIDRGPQSADVIERLRQLQDGPVQHHFLLGNHEAGLLGYLQDPHGFYARWLEFGGIETARSYGCDIKKHPIMPEEREALQKDLIEKIPEPHISFMQSLEQMKIFGDYCFVHAGIRPEVPLTEQNQKDLTFIREPFLSWKNPHEKCIVHGHTISEKPEITSNRLGLDTGLFRTGLLTCAVLEKNTVQILQVNNRN